MRYCHFRVAFDIIGIILKILFLFIDGVGMRPPASDNPVNSEVCPTLCTLFEKHAKPVEASREEGQVCRRVFSRFGGGLGKASVQVGDDGHGLDDAGGDSDGGRFVRGPGADAGFDARDDSGSLSGRANHPAAACSRASFLDRERERLHALRILPDGRVGSLNGLRACVCGPEDV